MHIIEIAALSNGAHRNQSGKLNTVPPGWAVIPPGLAVPDTFPFVGVTAEEAGGVMTVTELTPGVIPEEAPLPEEEL